MKSLYNNIMAGISKSIKEAIDTNYGKYMNLSQEEIDKLNNSVKTLIDKYSRELDKLTDIDDKPIEGRRYILRFKNPFFDTSNFALQDDNWKTNPKQIPNDLPETIDCIGICDKYGQIHLPTIWNGDAYIKWTPLKTITYDAKYYDRYGEEYDTGYKSLFDIPAGYKLFRKNLKCYRTKLAHVKRGETRYHYVSGKELNGVYDFPLEMQYCISAQDFNAKVGDMKTKLDKEEADKLAKEKEEALQKQINKIFNEHNNEGQKMAESFLKTVFEGYTNLCGRKSDDLFIRTSYTPSQSYRYPGKATYIINSLYDQQFENMEWYLIRRSGSCVQDLYRDFWISPTEEYIAVNFKEKLYDRVFNNDELLKPLVAKMQGIIRKKIEK